MQRRDFLIGVMAAGLLSKAATAQPAPHWLIGTWLGEIRNLPDKYGNFRRIVVVAVNGSDVTMRYGAPDSSVTPTIHGTVDGDELRFTTVGTDTGSNKVIMKRGGDDGMAGTWQSARIGKTYQISFKRQKTP